MKRSTILLILFALAFVAGSTFGVEEFKITAEDAEAEDQFGCSVSIDGDYAIVGAIGNDDEAENSGSAYIFIRDGEEWTEQQKLTADDADEEDYFGSSVSISGDYVIVSAYDSHGWQSSGSAYIFVRNGEEWTQQQKLIADDAAENDRFHSVSISGDYAIVGAYGNDDDGESSGSAYIFVRDGEEWTEQEKLTADDAAEGDYFGFSVSISGDYAIVGAFRNDDDGDLSGSAYVFLREGDEWTQQQKLTADDAAEEDLFGLSVSINGDYVIIGAYRNDDDGENSGSAYIFVRDGDEWTQQQKLTADDAAANDEFGCSVSLSGDYAIVGASRDDDDAEDSGSAYVFVFIGDEWIQQQKLTADDADSTDAFGHSVSIDINHSIIGSPWNDDDGETSGSAYIYTLVSEITVSHDELMFGEVWVGESEELILIIANEGDFHLTISEIAVEGDYFTTDLEEEVVLTPEDTLAVVMTFAPEEMGIFNGTLTITSDDPDDEEVTVELLGVGDTEVKFTRIDFYENVEPTDSNPDNLINPGQNIRFKVLVANELDRNIMMGSGTIESRTEGIEVIEDEVAFNNIRSGQAEWSAQEFEVTIAEDFEPGGYASFSLTMEYEADQGSPWISSFRFPVAQLATGLIMMDDDNNPDSDGDDDDIAEPSEVIEVIPLINNASPDIWHQVSGQLTYAGWGNFISIWDDVEGASGIVLDTWRYHFIDNRQQPIEPDAENIQPEEDFVFEYSAEEQEVYELLFDLIISGYHNEAAGNAWDEGGVLMKWSSRFVINEGQSAPNAEEEIPTEFSLSQPYPNPFNSMTRLSFDLPLASNVSLQVFDLTGRLITTLIDQTQARGNYTVRWNGLDAPAGIYLVRMETDAFSAVRKVVLVK